MVTLYIWIIIWSVLWNMTDGFDHLDDELDKQFTPEEKKKPKDRRTLNSRILYFSDLKKRNSGKKTTPGKE